MRTLLKHISAALFLGWFGLTGAQAQSMPNKMESVMTSLGWMTAQAAFWRGEVDASPTQPEEGLLLLIHTISFAAVRPCDTDLYLYINYDGKLAFAVTGSEWQVPVIHGLQYSHEVDDQAQNLADSLRQRDLNARDRGNTDHVSTMPYWRFFEIISTVRCTKRHDRPQRNIEH